MHDFADLTNARVLDAGCGNGNRMWRYAAAARWVVGIDPSAERLPAAFRERPPALCASTTFARARAETLPFPRETFDVVVLSWAL